MMINLNLNKVDEAKMKEVMRKDRRPFTQVEVKQWFLGSIKSVLYNDTYSIDQ